MGQEFTCQLDPDKLSTFTNVKTPGNISDVWRSLGMFNQLSKFIPTCNLGDEMKLLRDLLQKDCPWMWERP